MRVAIPITTYVQTTSAQILGPLTGVKANYGVELHNTYVKLTQAWGCPRCIITINVPVVYMARYIIVLRQARSSTRGIERGGPWKSRVFGP